MNTGKMRTSDDIKALEGAVLLVAMEMSLKTWRLAMGPSGSDKERQIEVTAGHYAELSEAVAKAQEKFGMDKSSRVVLCYEAGREGFHPYRVLSELGHTAWIIDSSSIEVNRRARRAKNDAVDASKILTLLQRQWRGERALKIAHVPTVDQEDHRQSTREREVLVKERGRVRVRIQSLLFAQGIRDFPKSVAGIERWLTQQGASVPKHLRARIERDVVRLKLTDRQLKDLNKEQHVRCTTKAADVATDPIAQQLTQLKGIGEIGACILSSELFGWRHFNNRREVGACVGLTPTPYDSGESSREQGISKAGNKRIRRVIVEVAWKWLDYQPDSALSRWFMERFGKGKRSRRIGIVALARKLLVALWHYLEHGVIPNGAQLKA
jgi:transposase